MIIIELDTDWNGIGLELGWYELLFIAVNQIRNALNWTESDYELIEPAVTTGFLWCSHLEDTISAVLR